MKSKESLEAALKFLCDESEDNKEIREIIRTVTEEHLRLIRHMAAFISVYGYRTGKCVACGAETGNLNHVDANCERCCLAKRYLKESMEVAHEFEGFTRTVKWTPTVGEYCLLSEKASVQYPSFKNAFTKITNIDGDDIYVTTIALDDKDRVKDLFKINIPFKAKDLVNLRMTTPEVERAMYIL